MTLNVADQKEIKIGDSTYILTAFPAMFGIDVQLQLLQLNQAGIPYSTDLVEKVVTKGATLGSLALTKQKIDSHFRKKLPELLKLFEEILVFNFGDGDENSPNGESDTSES